MLLRKAPTSAARAPPTRGSSDPCRVA